MPEEELFDAILAGRSMYINSAKHRVLCSSIVGGILPIAAGVALGSKRNGGCEKVWVMIGDMCATTGLFHEFKQFVRGHDLPVRIIVEDNTLSTDTPTLPAWGSEGGIVPVETYKYERTTPHVGIGTYVAF
jgi:TPP-dependent pyruvate/acetoin dehydrogenase alpha subunit